MNQSPANTVHLLNRLLALHGGSLPMYLVSAPPHRQSGEEKAWDVLRHVINDQQLMIDKLADHIESLDGTPNMGEFPMEFSGFHDLSLDFIVQQVVQRQQKELEVIESISDELEPGTQGRALAQEALGAAKAHLQSLEEASSSVT